MQRNKEILVCFGAACVILAIGLFVFGGRVNAAGAIFWVFDSLGRGLRMLSLSDGAGNVAAWAVYILIGCIPLIFPALRMKRKVQWTAFDGLCALLSLYTFVYLFLLINPSRMAGIANPMAGADGGKYIMLALFGSLICSAAIVYALEAVSWSKALGGIRGIVVFLACLGLFSVCFVQVYDLLASFFVRPPTDDYLGAWNNAAFTDGCLAVFRFVSKVLPMALLLTVVSPALQLLYGMEKAPYSRENAECCAWIAKRARLVVLASVFCSLGFNLVQLFAARYAADVRIETAVPVTELLISFVMLYLTGYFAESAKLHEENRQFV